MKQETYSHYGEHSVDSFVQELLLNPEEQKRVEALLGLIPPEVESVLDVGAGHGVLLKEIQSRGLICEGVEITEAKVNFAQQKYNLKMTLGSADSLPFGDANFDLVYCCEVLEHLPFSVYEKSLKELARVARKAVIVSVPYDEIRLMTKCPYCQTLFYPNYHLRTFNPTSLDGLLERFRIKEHLLVGSTFSLGLLPKTLRSLIRRDFPPLAYCPACGFHITEESHAFTPEFGGGKLRAMIKRILPRRHRWHVALYLKI